MAHRRTLSDDRHDVRASESLYSPSGQSTQRRLESHQGSGHEATHTSLPGPLNVYSQDSTASSFASTTMHHQDQARDHEWYPTNEAQAMSGNYSGYMVGNSRVAVGKSNEQYPGGDNNRQPINYNGEQKVSKVQTNAQFDRLAQNSSAPGRSHGDIWTNEFLQEYGQETGGTASPTPKIRHRVNQPLKSGMKAQSSSEELKQNRSNTQARKIGVVYSNVGADGFRYGCHMDGCANRSFGRPRELKRHWESFHEDQKIWCLVRGCERSKGLGGKPFSMARKDKLREHARKKHKVELEL